MDRLPRIADGRLGGEHFVDAVDGYCCARHKDKGHADHQKRHDDLYRILHECHHIAHLHGGLLDLMPAYPDDHKGHQVHQEHHRGHHEGGDAVDKAVVAGKLAVGNFKTVFLILLRAEGAYDHHTAQMLAHDEIQTVDQLLDELKFRHDDRIDDGDKPDQDQDAYGNDPAHGCALRQCHYDTAHADDRCIQKCAGHQNKKELDLVNIVCRARDERRSRELVKLPIGERGNLLENIMAHIAADAGGKARGAEGNADNGKHHAERHEQHFRACNQNVIAFDLICIDAELLIELFGHDHAHLRADGIVGASRRLLRLLKQLPGHGLDQSAHRIELRHIHFGKIGLTGRNGLPACLGLRLQ